MGRPKIHTWTELQVQVAETNGICRRTFMKRVQGGMSADVACTEPLRKDRPNRVELHSYRRMMNRLKRDPYYADVTISHAWSTFEGFLRDMGNCNGKISIDRIDNTLGYSADNCRWVTPAEQLKNKGPHRGKKKPRPKGYSNEIQWK